MLDRGMFKRAAVRPYLHFLPSVSIPPWFVVNNKVGGFKIPRIEIISIEIEF